MLNRDKWLGSILIVAISAAGGFLFYLLWMAIAIPTIQAQSDMMAAALWMASPVLTALGFTTGAYIAERRIRGGEIYFLRIYLWPLAGCAIGAMITYVFGPMLIVFGMLFLGTASIALREIWILIGKNKLG
jgi:hypothetical protein